MLTRPTSNVPGQQMSEREPADDRRSNHWGLCVAQNNMTDENRLHAPRQAVRFKRLLHALGMFGYLLGVVMTSPCGSWSTRGYHRGGLEPSCPLTSTAHYYEDAFADLKTGDERIDAPCRDRDMRWVTLSW
jgi:hypothetical protein